MEELMDLYSGENEDHKIAVIAAQVESDYSGIYTRVEEIMEFAKRLGYRKIGIATCSGLLNESKVLAKILRLNGFEVYAAVCKVGSIEKTSVGIALGHTKPGPIMCNPILQAKK